MQFQLNTNGKEASEKNSSAMFIEIASTSISEIIFDSIALESWYPYLEEIQSSSNMHNLVLNEKVNSYVSVTMYSTYYLVNSLLIQPSPLSKIKKVNTQYYAVFWKWKQYGVILSKVGGYKDFKLQWNGLFSLGARWKPYLP